MTRSYLGYVSSQTTDTIVVQGYGTATGGSSSSITVDGVNYTLLTFTSSGTLTVSKAGLFDVLVVGGGGGGGRRSTTNVGSGGGGGGAVIEQTIYLSANATVTIGAKGAAQTNTNSTGNQGSFSRVNQLCAGGGGGGMGETSGLEGRKCDAAGSGGGSFGTFAIGADLERGRALITIGANDGGTGGFTTNAAGGGGGGSTQVGQNNSGNNGGAGGTGTDVSTFIAGSALYHGAGGGGGSVGATGGTAGNSTGGNGGSSAGAGSNATATNYGCGGGGGASSGGAGADGVVYVRFKV
jgi:hypothetical protein